MRGLLLLSLLCASACNTQRVPGPMGRPDGLVLPGGQASDYVPGPQEVIVVRHGDPVSVRRPEATAGFLLSFYDKRMRLGSGGWVLSGTGGRAEIFWPGTATEIQLFDTSSVMIGEPTRAEPILFMSHCSFARIELSAGHRISLVGGAELVGDEELDSGPFEFRTISNDRISVANNGSTLASVLFLDKALRLGPGEWLELPLLPSGADPRPAAFGDTVLEVDADFVGSPPHAQGELELLPLEGRLSLRAKESVRVEALGVAIDLKAGEEVIFSPTGSRP